MKHIFFFLTLFFATLSYGQSPYIINYNSSAGWTTSDATGMNANNPHSPHRINIVNGQLEYTESGGSPTITNGNDYPRAVYDLGDDLCNYWIATFEFQPKQIGTQNNSYARAAAPIFMVTDGDGNPVSRSTNSAGNTRASTDMDVIGAFFVAEAGSNGQCRLSPFVKDGTTLSWCIGNGNDPRIYLGTSSTALNKWYKVTIERMDALHGRFTVEELDRKGGRPVRVYESKCFDILPNIDNLTHIQHGNLPGNGAGKKLSASLDDIRIDDCTRTTECCIPNAILTDQSICSDETGVFSVTDDPNLSYYWHSPTHPNLVFRNQGTANASITDWGNIYQTENVEIAVTITCACMETTISTIVEVKPSLQIYADNYTVQSVAPSGSTFDIEVFSTLTQPQGLSHTWEVYVAANQNGNSDCEQGAFFNSSTANPVIGNTLVFPGASKGTIYLIVHTVTNADGSCAATKCKKVLHAGRQANGGMTHNIYPNPSTGSITVDYKGEIENTRILVKDVIGRTIQEHPVQYQNTRLFINENGMYTVEIWKGEELQQVEKVIITE